MVGIFKPPKGGFDAGNGFPKDNWPLKIPMRALDNIGWDGLSGPCQNAVTPSHPDPIAGNHAWHQKVIIEPAKESDTIGDIYVNYETNFKVYQAWRDKLTRPLKAGDTLRRPKHMKRTGSSYL